MNNLCQQHGNQSITHICTYNHKCQKLMCPLSQYQHQKIYPQQKTIPIDLYVQNLNIEVNNIEEYQYDILLIEKKQQWIQMKFKLILEIKLYLEELNQKITNIKNYFRSILQKQNQKIFIKYQKFVTINFEISDKNKIQHYLNNNEKIRFNLFIFQQINRYIGDSNKQISGMKKYQIILMMIFQLSMSRYKYIFFYGISMDRPDLLQKRRYQEQYGSIILNQNENFQNQSGLILFQQRLRLTHFQIKYQMMKDNSGILKMEKYQKYNIHNLNEIHDINRNLEQVKHMRWKDNMDQNFRKLVNGMLFGRVKNQMLEVYMMNKDLRKDNGLNNQRFIIREGQYDLLEIKVGIWVELHKNYNNKNQVFYIGHGRKSGTWETQIKNETQFESRRLNILNYFKRRWELQLIKWFEDCSCKLMYINGQTKENGIFIYKIRL
ncbi:unnamed protein product [Paramecium sonneborni]|uniref:Uncharacterized protein n=1 Tax=Paramecium sonneborni TaxID=65129 RepID=A0A8S1RIX5_9CILI|nr:unnamed protein product [Paramecium sonneborni]